MLLGAAAVTPASAQAMPDSQNGRYVFAQPADGGVVRLDTRTGQVSTCTRQGTGWACYVVPDERAALEAEIARLQVETGRLKNELLGRGQLQPRGPVTEAKPPESKLPESKPPEARQSEQTRPDLKLPDDAEFNRAMAFMEKVWRRLIEMVMRLQQDMAGNRT
ncbi:MAG: hypothetical protein EPO23_07620 [Xanthobacteraceae bacterium]|nr:MAG: hypothetical protein EPO23_07620 [Xanthobacteraceae bacterium]